MSKIATTWLKRAGFALAAAALGISVPSVAHADERGSVYAWASNTTIGQPSAPGKAVPVWVSGHNAVDPKMSIDTSKLAGVATATALSDACATRGTLITCVVTGPTFDAMFPIGLQAAAGSKAGATATLEITVSATNASTYTARAQITIADGVDLIATSPRADGTAKPGDTVYTKMSYANVGNQTTDDSAFEVYFQPDMTPVRYQGCTYTSVGQLTLMTCPLEQPLAPGEEIAFYTVNDDGTQTEGAAAFVEADAMGGKLVEFNAVVGVTSDLPQSLAGRSAKSTTGKRYRAVPVPRAAVRARSATEIDSLDNWGTSQWTIANTFDIATIGATARGSVDDVVTVAIGVRNNGPGSIDIVRSGGEPTWRYTFAVPEGTDAVAVPVECIARVQRDGQERMVSEPGHRFYECTGPTNYFAAGSTGRIHFKLKITKMVPDAAGTVAFDSHYTDANPSNDRAAVVINPTGDTGGGELPVTGAQIGGIVAGGAALLGAGIALFVVGRRRRVRLLTPGGRLVE